MDQAISLVEKKPERNYGIDLFRIVSMIMVLVLHVLGQGHAIYAEVFSSNFYTGWFLETAAYGAVNCFGLISGYVGYKAKHKYANILYINLQVTILLLISISIYKIRYPEEVVNKDFLKAALPFAHYVLWYYLAYFCMFFFIPFMNILIKNVTRNQGRLLVITIFVIFSIIPNFFNYDLYGTSYGYSALWLCLCYLIGAYFSKYSDDIKIGKSWLALIYLISVTIAWGYDMILTKLQYQPYFLSTLIDYTSPCILVSSCALLLLFSKIKPPKVVNYGIKFFAPLAFSVYIIHVSPYFWKKFMANRFSSYTTLNPFLFPLAVLGTAILLFICFALIDYVRLLLFKLCRIKQICEWIEKKIRSLFEKKKPDEIEKENL